MHNDISSNDMQRVDYDDDQDDLDNDEFYGSNYGLIKFLGIGPVSATLSPSIECSGFFLIFLFF